MLTQYKNLQAFWDTLSNSAVITLKDIDKLKDLLSKAYLEIQDLSNSRDKWHERCKKAESELSMLKKKKMQPKG